MCSVEDKCGVSNRSRPVKVRSGLENWLWPRKRRKGMRNQASTSNVVLMVCSAMSSRISIGRRYCGVFVFKLVDLNDLTTFEASNSRPLWVRVILLACCSNTCCDIRYSWCYTKYLLCRSPFFWLLLSASHRNDVFNSTILFLQAEISCSNVKV